MAKIEGLKDDLTAVNQLYEYRLRVGDYRVLFEIEEDVVVIYRIKHRSKAYS
ncbi:MAG: type II toxin-antitoxin system RelE/ParE family toxin [Hormoscilla sp. SP5CHS1]|nr:type II toxin-antitoxin system RelE/ParE family toxin [Hormoscilla sp. SP12CHS1]MBC6455927.1 type II toxin-antitoxin system RelE/ParE family toxin [Hormoscilla sp. SP5CHS1]